MGRYLKFDLYWILFYSGFSLNRFDYMLRYDVTSQYRSREVLYKTWMMYRDGTLKIRYYFYCNFNRQNNILYTCHPSQPTWHPGLIHFKTSSIYDIRFLRKAANNSIEKKERIWRNRPKKTLPVSLQMWFRRLNF